MNIWPGFCVSAGSCMHVPMILYLLRAMRIAVIAISMSVVSFGMTPAFSQHTNSFPSPHGLRPTIEFWKNVFAVWSEDEIVAHDRDDLSIIYRVVPQEKSDDDAIRKANQKEQKALKAH
ncbi:MAG: hypothetical protein KAI97_04435, partial [Gemmatimonadetes bacterium]|nr:hypothetical protein [Gemmatimonadota bacterium]